MLKLPVESATSQAFVKGVEQTSLSSFSASHCRSSAIFHSSPMASVRKWREGDSSQRLFVLHTPRFFRVMIQKDLDRGKVAIPSKFIRKCGNDLSNEVLLKTPNGESFRVALEKSGMQVFLSRGWREFQEYHSLILGSLIHFELERNDVLNVQIFDKSCTEIDYPIEVSHSDGENQQDDEHDRDPEQTGDSPSEETTNASSRPVRKRRRFMKHPGSTKTRIVKEPLPLSSDTALEAAKRYITELPTFRLRLRHSYMRSGGVGISSKFMKKNQLEPGESMVELKHRRKSWTVKMLCYQEEHRGKLCSGWSVFLEDNRLLHGDVCVFELIKKNVFYVHFFRCSSYM
ncbi:hypothetical protein SAY86_007935 [Trapa natans]|uniref:TF-B3 domain-containing protein n=1 Tax=Trapa natans TaxID=22666 RepID=A0AAN7LMK3_TRANT|nr:hypothetical protein SAY86_007935 [Trapa natans]